MTILNTFTQHIGGLSIGFWISAVVWLTVAIGFLTYSFKSGESAYFALVVICIVFGVTFGGLIYAAGGEPITETRYQVIFSDADAMNEALEKYDVVEVKGQIFTITEKTADT